ncbi:MAG: hypothetical protein JW751_05325 [Polyangiaceae bacterium]|nr:hypothetical protein [Polyangiaceae bacterium]
MASEARPTNPPTNAQSQRLRVSGYRAGPKNRRALAVRAKHDGLVLAPPKGECHGDITGSWQQDPRWELVGKDYDKWRVATLCINRAGPILVGWLNEYRPEQKEPQRIEVIGTEASHDVVETFDLQDSSGNAIGKLVWNIDLETISLRLGDGRDYELTRVNKQPWLSDQALKAFPTQVAKAVRGTQRTPLPNAAQEYIKNAFSVTRFGALVESHLAIGNQHGFEDRGRFAIEDQGGLNGYLAKIFLRLHPSERESAASLAMILLTSRTYKARKGGAERPLLEWIEIMVEDTRGHVRQWTHDRAHQDYRYFWEEFLGVKLSEDRYRYSMSFKVKSLGLPLIPGAGVSWGSLTVTVGEPGAPDERYEMKCKLADANLGKGLSFGQTAEGAVASPIRWRQEDFVGDFSLESMGASVGPWSHDVIVPQLTFFGADVLRPLKVQVSGVTFGDSHGLSASKGSLSIERKNSSPGPSTVSKKMAYARESPSRTAVHFPFNHSELTAQGRREVGIVAARELAVFRSKGAAIRIVSHADCPDTEEYNLRLTELRAANTAQAFQDMLGEDYVLKAKADGSPSEDLIPLGEVEAQKAYGKHSKERSPVSRRSDVLITGAVAAELLMTTFRVRGRKATALTSTEWSPR